MIYKNYKEANKIAESNLLHDIIIPTKHAKKSNSHYSPILHGCMYTRIGIVGFNNFRTLLDSGFSPRTVMGRIVENIRLEKDAVMQWNTQDGNITNNLRVKVDFTLPSHSVTNSVTWKCHVYESAKGRYDMILGQDI